MDQLLYSNAFSVVFNQNSGEIFLSFALEYPQVTVPAADRKDRSQVETKRQNVCSLILPQTAAEQLIEILKKSLSGEQKDE